MSDAESREQPDGVALPDTLPLVPVSGQGAGGSEVPGQADAAVPVVPVETPNYPRRSLTPVTLLLTIFLAYFLYKVEYVVVTLIVGIVLATAISGPTEFLSRRVRLPRPLAILLVYVAILVGLGGFFSLLIPPVAHEATHFAQALPELTARWRTDLLASRNGLVQNLAQRAFDALDQFNQSGSTTTAVSTTVGVVSGIGNGLVTVFTIFLIAFYWMTEKTALKRSVLTLFAPGQRSRVLHLWSDIELQLGAWLRGQLLLMLIIGSAATVTYGVMRLPFWLVLGVIAGLTEAIPNVGPVLGAVPAVLVALSVDWKLAVAVVAFVTVLQLTENAILVPRIMKGAVGLSPLTVILAILAGSEYRGVAGALLAVPIAGVLSLILRDVLNERHAREGVAPEPPHRQHLWLPRRLRRRATDD